MRSDTPRSLNLALLGYGHMGKRIAPLAPERGFEVRLVVTSASNPAIAGAARRHSIVAEDFQDIDVGVDFTTRTAVVENVRKMAALGCSLVVGTTGWHEHLDEVRKLVEAAGIGMVYAANFSIGVQLFYRAAEAAAKIFADFPTYEPYITETHHRLKKDAPSGTALELKRRVQAQRAAASGSGPHEMAISSIRAGYAPGTHELGFDSEADTVILRHTARSRQGFAEGALYAARWVAGKKGLFTFADILGRAD